MLDMLTSVIVCNNCTCEETVDKNPDEVFMLGHAKACPEKGCKSIKVALNWPARLAS